jgi:hypothetical protein
MTFLHLLHSFLVLCWYFGSRRGRWGNSARDKSSTTFEEVMILRGIDDCVEINDRTERVGVLINCHPHGKDWTAKIVGGGGSSVTANIMWFRPADFNFRVSRYRKRETNENE